MFFWSVNPTSFVSPEFDMDEGDVSKSFAAEERLPFSTIDTKTRYWAIFDIVDLSKLEMFVLFDYRTRCHFVYTLFG